MHRFQSLPKIFIFEVDPALRDTWDRISAGYETICIPEALTLENVEKYSEAVIISIFLG